MRDNQKENDFFTREMMAEALLKLLKRKPYDDIKVVEIADTAGVSRSSFYRYFNKSTKKDLILEYILYLWDKYILNMNNNNSLEKSFLILLKFIYNYKDIFALLNKSDLNDIIFNLINHIIDSIKIEDVVKAFIAGSIYGLVIYWISIDFKTSPEEIVKTFMNLKRD